MWVQLKLQTCSTVFSWNDDNVQRWTLCERFFLHVCIILWVLNFLKSFFLSSLLSFLWTHCCINAKSLSSYGKNNKIKTAWVESASGTGWFGWWRSFKTVYKTSQWTEIEAILIITWERNKQNPPFHLTQRFYMLTFSTNKNKILFIECIFSKDMKEENLIEKAFISSRFFEHLQTKRKWKAKWEVTIESNKWYKHLRFKQLSV